MHITPEPDSDRKYFFWLWPAANQAGADDVVIWLNGGPGCSSVEGALQEIGPVVFPYQIIGLPKRDRVELNPYSWDRLATIVTVDQPIGTGFSSGTPTAKDCKDVAEQFYGFLVNLLDTFSELKGKKLWRAGESFSIRYISYIASKITPTKVSMQRTVSHSRASRSSTPFSPATF